MNSKSFLIILFLSIFLYCSINSKFRSISNFDFEYELDKIETENIKIGKNLRGIESCLKISINNKAYINEKGFPELPIIRKSIILPNDGEFKVEIEEISSHEIPVTEVIIPSRGQILRNIKKDQVPYIFNEQYEKNEFYPKNIVDFSIHKMRDIRGAILEFHPIRYNAVEKKIIVIDKIKINLNQIKINRKINKVHDNIKIVDKDFFVLYKNIYSNFEHYDDVFLPSDLKGRILIIYDSVWEEKAKMFENLKKEQGFPTAMLLVSKSDKPEDIRNKIKEFYLQSQKLTYAVIIGKNVPSFTSKSTRYESDAMYSYLETDLYDIFVSRITGTKSEHFDAQFEKIKLYPTLSFSLPFMKRFVSGTDNLKQTSQPPDDELIRIMQKKFNEKFPIIPRMVISNSPSAKVTSQLFDELNQGCGFYQFAGDGSGTSEYQMGLSTSNVNNITYEKPFFTYEAACVNGDWRGISTCFADSIMWLDRTRGAVSMYSSAPNAEWDPPMKIQGKGYDMFISGDAKTIGLAYYGANLNCYHEGTSDRYTLEGYGIFGDSSLELPWMK